MYLDPLSEASIIPSYSWFSTVRAGSAINVHFDPGIFREVWLQCGSWSLCPCCYLTGLTCSTIVMNSLYHSVKIVLSPQTFQHFMSSSNTMSLNVHQESLKTENIWKDLIQRESYGIIWALDHFKYYVLGRRPVVFL